MIPLHLSSFANHLWQSTLFAGLVALLTLALSKNRAQIRYRLWLAASVKLLIPFSLLVTLGSQFEWRTAPAVVAPLSLTIEQISQSFAPFPMPRAETPAAPAVSPLASALFIAVWLGGCAVVLSLWCARWRRIRAALRTASPFPIQAPIEVMSSPTLLEPGVWGVFRPVLLLPEGIAGRLTPGQFTAILAHELCHVRRRDNLAAAIHMVVEAVFWFHPVVWWIGARLVEERERACDEEVLRLGSQPEVYAEGILNVCKFYLESPLACASGVTGWDLKKRIEAIITNRLLPRLTFARNLLLATVGLAALAGPIFMGVVNAPQSRAQSQAGSTAPLTFKVVSIKRVDSEMHNEALNFAPDGGLTMANTTLKTLVAFAYDVREFQISGGPAWFGSERYDIRIKPERPEGPADLREMTEDQQRLLFDRLRQRLRALLAERFQLTIHRDTKGPPVYALVLAKNGPKLQAANESGHQFLIDGRGQITAGGMSIERLAETLSNRLGRPVLDQTGLKGEFDCKMEWTPDPGGPMPRRAPGETPNALFTAVQEQLGLKLESARAEIIVVDRAEKPSEN